MITDTYLQAKIRKYLDYDVSQAETDAASDFATGRMRIFFLAVDEVSAPIGLEAVRNRLPTHATTFIGEGCIDPTNDEECPPEYRQAMGNAIEYARSYNSKIAELTGTGKAQQATALSNTTAEFIGPENEWRNLRIELVDVVGPFGGRTIEVLGGGQTCIRLFRHGKSPVIHRISISATDVQRIVRSFIGNDFCSILIPVEMAEPETPRPSISLCSPQNGMKELSAWLKSSSPPIPGQALTAQQRFQNVYGEIRRLESLVTEK